MRVLSVLLLIAASSMCADAYYWGYYYPYSYAYYPFYSYYGGYGYGGWYGKRADSISDMPKQRTDCVFVKNDNTFKCTGPLGEVECDAEWKFDEDLKLEMFGIGKPDDFEAVTVFKLFPRKLDNSGWISNLVKSKGEEFNVTLHQISDSNSHDHDLGLMVREKKCFQKIIDLLRDSKRDEKVHLQDLDTSVHIIGDFSQVIRAKRSVGKYDNDDKIKVEREIGKKMEKEHIHKARGYSRYNNNHHNSRY